MTTISRRQFSSAALGVAAMPWPVFAASPGSLGDLGAAPEFTGIEKWLNSAPLSIQGLAGKVVLVDFWTYSCVNCINTLSHVVRWYERYRPQGFVVVGVHTPEFPFEKSTANVEAALQRFNIRYPVAQDNRYATWKAYGNRYWPAFYLVDKSGRVRHQHFGEGKYEEMEQAIRMLLA
jgi:thiol-disulfide isomerase/thioredoxin